LKIIARGRDKQWMMLASVLGMGGEDGNDYLS